MFGHQDHQNNNQPVNTFSSNDNNDPPMTMSPNDNSNSASVVSDTGLAPETDNNNGNDLPLPTPATSSMDEQDVNDLDSVSLPDSSDNTPQNDGSPSPMTDLMSIKQNALQQLGPLMDHLDQSPEEKFRTTMMMIQAADNQSLIPVAYEAAQKIEDEKARAQALLDVINEINYFTQHNS